MLVGPVCSNGIDAATLDLEVKRRTNKKDVRGLSKIRYMMRK